MIAVLFTILIAIISILLILVVMVQNPKGGGLNSAFGGSAAANQIMGAANSTDMLEKITWGLASALLALSLATGLMFRSMGTDAGDGGPTIDTEDISTIPSGGPTLPTGAPINSLGFKFF